LKEKTLNYNNQILHGGDRRRGRLAWTPPLQVPMKIGAMLCGAITMLNNYNIVKTIITNVIPLHQR
jgi:hypothetical protein